MLYGAMLIIRKYPTYEGLYFVESLFSDSKDYCPVGIFTSMNRDKWAEVSALLFLFCSLKFCLLPGICLKIFVRIANLPVLDTKSSP